MRVSNWFSLDDEPERFSWDNCRRICSTILEFDFDNATSLDNASDVIIALLDDIHFLAELVLWGDKSDSSVVNLFQNMDTLRLLFNCVFRDAVPLELKVQILQTISIIFQNIRDSSLIEFSIPHETLSKLDAEIQLSESESDLVPAFINCLRTILARLNDDTCAMFVSETGDFPLLWIVASYVTHPDSLVRTTSRSIIMNTLTKSISKFNMFVKMWGNLYSLTLLELFQRKLLLEEEEYMYNQDFLLKFHFSPTNDQDDIVDIFSFLDDFLDSTDGESEIALSILQALLTHVASVSCIELRLLWMRHILQLGTHEIYAKEAILCFHPIISNALVLTAHSGVLGILCRVFENNACMASLSANRPRTENSPDVSTYVHLAGVMTLTIISSPESFTCKSFWDSLQVLRFLLFRCNGWQKTFRAILNTGVSTLVEKYTRDCALFESDLIEFAQEESAEGILTGDTTLHDDANVTSFLAISASASTFLEKMKSLDGSEQWEKNLAAIERYEEEWKLKFRLHLGFLALSDLLSHVCSDAFSIDQHKIFSFRRADTCAERWVNISDFSSLCGMIGVRCRILKASSPLEAMDTQCLPPYADWMIPDAFALEDCELSEGSLFYFFFADEKLYLVEPSLENLDHGKIVMQLPAFFCTTVVYSSTDSEIVIEFQTLDNTDRTVFAICLDFLQPSNSRNVAEAVFVYIQKIREGAQMKLKEYVSCVSHVQRSRNGTEQSE